MSRLQSGIYIITNVAANAALIPTGEEGPILISPPGARPAHFDLQVQPDGVIFRINGTPLIKDDNILFVRASEPELWKVTPDERSGGSAFIIESNDRSAGWVATNEDRGSEVSVSPLIVGPAFPPFYPPTELWKLTRVDDD